MPQVSVIVPTYREAENLPELVSRIHDSVILAGLTTEILIVDDDSRDGTVEVCEQLRRFHPVRLIIRQTERGLSSAVVAGMKQAEGDILIVMDADLSHPPEKIPELVATLREPGVDFVVGSRYVPGAETDAEWNWFRHLNSQVATWMAWPFTRIQDPMSGFFALRRDLFLAAADRLDPIGYKIGLELIVKCGCQNVREVPILFMDRVLGESKLSLRVQLQYVKHLRKLAEYRYPLLTQVLQFGCVGASGLVVDVACFAAALLVLPTAAARAAAIWVAMTWNFAGNRHLTFADSRVIPLYRQYVRFCLSCSLGAIANWSTSLILLAGFPFFERQPWLLAIPGSFAGLFFNFLLCRLWVFRPLATATPLDTLPASDSPSAGFVAGARLRVYAPHPGSEQTLPASRRAA